MKTFLEIIKTNSGLRFPQGREGGAGNIGKYTQDSNCSYNLILKLNGGYVGVLYFISVLRMLEILHFFLKNNEKLVEDE